MSEADRKLFESIGLSPKLVKSFIKSEHKATNLKNCIKEAGILTGCDSSAGNLIYDVSTNKTLNSNENGINNRPVLLSYIVNGSIKTPVQLRFAIDYCNKTNNSNFDNKKFEQICGVNVIVTKEEIISTVDKTIESMNDYIRKDGKKSFGKIMSQIRNEIPFADGKLLNQIFNEKFKAAVIAATALEEAKNSEEKQKQKEKSGLRDDFTFSFDKLESARDLALARNNDLKLKEYHNALSSIFGDSNKFLTRFPPEPNGFLHIGHCKAMTFNFSVAERNGGSCYLRFDDTNPETEDNVYISNIIENVEWMGFKPWKISYSSDYFDQLYELAIKLIKNGDAYVCHSNKEEIEMERESFRNKKHEPNKWRDTNIDENLHKFELMRMGYYEEGEACLRMKGDIYSNNPNLWDPIAYRIKYLHHPKSKDKWCIYPSYDFTHCICDSLEWIGASCCTLEFENRRESYFWLLDKLNLYKPVVFEYSRLNLMYNVLSKRKLLKLVKGGYVRGWDDPRLLTINGLRRRGYSAQILRKFCNDVGVTRNSNYIHPKKLESTARKLFDQTCSRVFAVSKPLKIIITNYPTTTKNNCEDIECPKFPNNKNKINDTYKVKFSNIIYIDRKDFRLKSDKNGTDFIYYGLEPGKTVRLKYAYDIICKNIVFKNNGMSTNVDNIDYIECIYDPKSKTTHSSDKGHLSWISEKDGIECEIRFYDHLFNVAKPGGNDWLSQLNDKSEVISNGLVNKQAILSNDKRFQFERMGYFIKDINDYTDEKPVFNCIVGLKSSVKK